MAIKLYPDSREVVEIVLTADEALQAVNTQEALDAYRKSGDLASLSVPADASRVRIRPMTASADSAAARDAGERPFGVWALWSMVTQRVKDAPEGADPIEVQAQAMDEVGYTDEHSLALESYHLRQSLALCSYGVESISFWPDAKPTEVAGLRKYPRDLLDRLPTPVLYEISAHIQRISSLSPEGKA